MENWWKTLLTNQDGDDEVRVKLDQGGEELTVPRDSIYQVLSLYLHCKFFSSFLVHIERLAHLFCEWGNLLSLFGSFKCNPIGGVH